MGAFLRHGLWRPKGKGPGGLTSPGPAPLARRRPGYSSSGCTPAEPNSASPGTGILSGVGPRSHWNLWQQRWLPTWGPAYLLSRKEICS